MQSDKHRLLATREQQDAQEFFSLSNRYTRIRVNKTIPPRQQTLRSRIPCLPTTADSIKTEEISVSENLLFRIRLKDYQPIEWDV